MDYIKVLNKWRDISYLWEKESCLCVCVWLLHSLGFLVSHPGIKPWPSEVKAWTLNQWTVREFLKERFSIIKCQTIQKEYKNHIYFLLIFHCFVCGRLQKVVLYFCVMYENFHNQKICVRKISHFFLYNFLFLSILFLNILFINFWLCWVFVATWGLSLVAVSRGYSLVVMCGLLISAVLAFLVAKHRLQDVSAVVGHRFHCSSGMNLPGIFPDQRSNVCPLHWQADS